MRRDPPPTLAVSSRPLSRLDTPWSLAAIATSLAAVVLIFGFNHHGLWSTGEIAVLQRAQADLGAALTGLERAPPLPDLLRTWALWLTGDPAAVRLPGALAGACLVGLATFLARRLGASVLFSVVAGAFVLAFPLLESQARLALGNPVGELLATLAAALGWAALGSPRRPLLLLAALLALAGAGASAGLLTGLLLPLLAIAIAWPSGHAPPDMSPTPAPPRWLALGLALAILATCALLLYLAYHQADGWIPALAAARDSVLRERPHTRPFTATFEELGDQLFPWLPLLIVGLLRPGRARWPALWLLTGLVLASVWSLRYGAAPLPLSVPAALVCTAALEHLLAATTAPSTRRLGLLIVIAGGLILAKDARRTPSHVGAVLVQKKGEHNYPAKELRAPDLLGGLAVLALAGLALAVLVRRSPATRLQSRLPAWLPPAIVLAVLVHHALRYGHDLLPRSSELQSLHRPLTRLAAWQAAGEFTTPLAVHRISDPGVDLYGPPPGARNPVTSRDAVIAWLKSQTANAALIRTSELAPIFQNARQLDWPLHVLDASHRDIMLVANALPPGVTDQNPIQRVLFDAPPVLPHPTLVRFEGALEIVAWDWEQPVVRGRETTLQVVLRVLGPLPSGSKITARLQKDRLSRINPLPHDLAENLYPCQYWRPGDYILHRFTTTVPMLEILPGAHELIVGLRRGDHGNFKISEPAAADQPGEHGVVVRAGQEFAVIGEVQVW